MNRRRQVVLAGILCATRFKFFDNNGDQLSVRCANGCGEADSWGHMLLCYKLHPPYEEEDPENWVSFLRTMARKTANNCLYIPVPMERPSIEQGGISFEESEPSRKSYELDITGEHLSFGGFSQ